MSLDIWLKLPEHDWEKDICQRGGSPRKCESCGQIVRYDGCTVADQNITHNVTPMWKAAGVYDALYMSDGQPVSQHLPALRNGVVQQVSVMAGNTGDE